MDSTLEEIGRVESSGPIWHYATALRLFSRIMRSAPLQPRNRPARQVRRLRPTIASNRSCKRPGSPCRGPAIAAQLVSGPLLLEGLIYEESHQEDVALAKYLEAVQQGENSPEVGQRALRTVLRQGRVCRGQCPAPPTRRKKVPFTTELFREQSRVLRRVEGLFGGPQSAQQVAAASKDYRDYLSLAQLLSVHGQPDEAEKALRQASLLNEKAPEILVAQVQFFVRAGQRDRAEKILASGREKIDAAAAPLALAACLEILGKIDEASQQYALALKQKPDDPGLVRSVGTFHMRHGDLSKAADQLIRIVDGQVRGTEQQVAASRADLARVRADQGGYQNLLEAIRLVDQNLATAPSSADNLRLKARFLAAHPQLSKRREAMAIYEKLAEDKIRAAAEDRFLLRAALPGVRGLDERPAASCWPC